VLIRVPELGLRRFAIAVRPAEMVRLELPRSAFEGVELERLTLEVVPRE